MITMHTTCFNIYYLCILPIESIYRLLMVLAVNSDYFLKHH